ncbi:MAG: S8 family serine peptidase [Bacteroidota bacterium]
MNNRFTPGLIALYFLIYLVGLPIILVAQDTGIINFYDQVIEVKSAKSANRASLEEDAYYFIHLDERVKANAPQRLIESGITAIQYVSDGTYIIKLDRATMEKMPSLTYVRFMKKVEPTEKIATSLLNYISEKTAPDTKVVFGPQGVPVKAAIFKGENLDEVAKQMEAIGATILSKISSNISPTISLQVPKEKIQELARLNGVCRIELSQSVGPQTDVARGIMNVEEVWANLNLKGANQTIAFTDGGLDRGDASDMITDLSGRVLNITNWPVSTRPSGFIDEQCNGQKVIFFLNRDNVGAQDSPADSITGHGTLVTAAAVGNGALSQGKYAGVAPEARVLFQAVEQRTLFSDDPATIDRNEAAFSGHYFSGIPDDLKLLFRQAFAEGAYIHSNSWASNVLELDASNYIDLDLHVDEFVWNNPEMLILFAAGNTGRDTNQDNVVENGSVRSPSTAKNCLSVGASENHRPNISNTYPEHYGDAIDADQVADSPEQVAAFSGRGPVFNGRTKPDVVAPGTMVASLRSRAIGMSETSLAPNIFNKNSGSWNIRQGPIPGAPALSFWNWEATQNQSSNTRIFLRNPVDISDGNEEARFISMWTKFQMTRGSQWFVEIKSEFGSTQLPCNTNTSTCCEGFVGEQNNWERTLIPLGVHAEAQMLEVKFFTPPPAPGTNPTGDYLSIADVRIVKTGFSLSSFDIDPIGSSEDQNYVLNSGTSISTPLTAGVAALVREYYTEVLKKNFVSAALIRATIMNGAVEIIEGTTEDGNPKMPGQPDNAQGWGRVDAANTLIPSNNGQLDHIEERTGLVTGEFKEYTLVVNDPDIPVSVTMVYHDYPGPHLVNDLDLSIIDPNGNVMHPNGLASADRVNNVEKIFIPSDNVIEGTYTIRIDGYNTPTNRRQPFAVATSAGGIIERPGVNVMLNLDVSGSMLNPVAPGNQLTKVEALDKAVKIFVELWFEFQSPNDRMGISYFGTNVENYSLANDLLPGFSMDDLINDIAARLGSVSFTSFTALGAGLQQSINILNGNDVSENKHIILFTDGVQNMDPSVSSDIPPRIVNTGGRPSNVQPTVPPTVLNDALGINIHAIGVGATPQFVNSLTAITDNTNGEFKYTEEAEEDLVQFFCELLPTLLREYSPQLLTYRRGAINNTGESSESFRVNHSASKLVVKASWEGGSVNTLDILKNGILVQSENVSAAADRYYIFSFEQEEFTNGLGDEWQVVIRGNDQTRYQVAVLVDEPSLDYNFSTGSDCHSSGETVPLSVSVQANGISLEEDLTVRATVYSPSVWKGELLAGTPVKSSSGVILEPNASIVERKLGVFYREEDWFRRLNRNELTVNLRHTGNGLYQFNYTNTNIPGTYTVRFEVEGVHPTAGSFTREETTTFNVGVAAIDEQASQIRIVNASTRKNLQLTISPRDVNGNLLGPAYGPELKVLSAGRNVVSEVTDKGNGNYIIETNIPYSNRTKLDIGVQQQTVFTGEAHRLVKKILSLDFHTGYVHTIPNDNSLERIGTLYGGGLEYRFHPSVGLSIRGNYYELDESSVTEAQLALKWYLSQNKLQPFFTIGSTAFDLGNSSPTIGVNTSLGLYLPLGGRLGVFASGTYIRSIQTVDELELFNTTAGVQLNF